MTSAWRSAANAARFLLGLTLLLHRRIFDPRIRLTSHRTDLFILIILWVQLSLGLITLPLTMLSPWQRLVLTSQPAEDPVKVIVYLTLRE